MTRRRYTIAVAAAAFAALALPGIAYGAGGEFVYNVDDTQRSLAEPADGACYALDDSTLATVNGTDRDATLYADARCQEPVMTAGPGSALVAKAAAVRFG